MNKLFSTLSDQDRKEILIRELHHKLDTLYTVLLVIGVLVLVTWGEITLSLL